VAGIYTGAVIVLIVQCHLENGNCTKQVDTGRGMHCYLIPVGTKHKTHNVHRHVYGADVMFIQEAWNWSGESYGQRRK